MKFNAFEFYWLLAEQQKMRGNTKLAESFYKKALEAAKSQELANVDGALIKSNKTQNRSLHSENFSSGK